MAKIQQHQPMQVMQARRNVLRLVPQIERLESSAILNNKIDDDNHVRLEYERDSVPALLSQQGVTLELWQQTYDIVQELCDKDESISQSIHDMRTLLAPVMYPYTKRQQWKLKRQWIQLLPQLRDEYDNAGIEVRLARNSLPSSTKIFNNGLEFQVTKPVDEVRDTEAIRSQIRLHSITAPQHLAKEIQAAGLSAVTV